MKQWTGLLEWSTGATGLSAGVSVASLIYIADFPQSMKKLHTMCQGLATSYPCMLVVGNHAVDSDVAVYHWK